MVRLVAEAMWWVVGLSLTIVPTLAQPTGFSNRSECGNNYSLANLILILIDSCSPLPHVTPCYLVHSHTSTADHPTRREGAQESHLMCR